APQNSIISTLSLHDALPILIVPNNTIVTSQRINVTLTDTITRVVLSFTVNRGNDLQQVHDLLLRACRENPRVLKEPAPAVLLTAYSPNGLTHDLMFHVRELGDRGAATDEINRRVDQLFIEHGLESSGLQRLELVRSAPTPDQPPAAE